MTVYLGVDGGGSTCRARAVDDSGRVLGEGLAGPANVTSDLQGSLTAILQAASAALGSHPLGEVHAALGLAGSNNRAAAAALARLLPFGRSKIVTDGHISVRGALGDRDGIVAALGTGSVFVVQRGGVQREIGGKGLVLGDEASGAWIGRRLLALALRAQDGFGPMTPLLQQVMVQQGGVEGIIAMASKARPVDFAALSPLVTGSKDPAAEAILAEASRDIHQAITLLQQGDRLPVVLLGGLADVFAPRMADWSLVPPQGTALDGAMALARSL